VKRNSNISGLNQILEEFGEERSLKMPTVPKTEQKSSRSSFVGR